jgi:flagellar biosynthesis protein FlhG
MTHDQATKLRELVRRVRCDQKRDAGGPRLMVVAGGRASVGATSTALHLAAALASESRRVLLVDADLDGAALTSLCGLVPERTLLDVLCGRCSLADAVVETSLGVKLLGGRWGANLVLDCPPAAFARLVDELLEIAGFDLVLVDVGCSRNQFVIEFWRAAHEVLLVTTPDDTALLSAYAAIKVFGASRPDAPVRLVVNGAPQEQTALGVAQRMASSAARFLKLRVELLGWAPPEARDVTAASQLAGENPYQEMARRILT